MTVKELKKLLDNKDPDDTILIEIDKAPFNNLSIWTFDERTEEEVPVAYFDMVKDNNWNALYK